MDWLVFWQCFIAMLALSFIALIFLALASGATAAKHKRRLEIIEAERLKVTLSNGSITVNAHNQDPKAVAEAVLRVERELGL